MTRFYLALTGTFLISLPQTGIGREFQQYEALGKEPNPKAVEAVMSGENEIASAAWWGFSEEDSTQFLQAAINAGAKTVVIPYMGNPWIIRPIKLRSNITLLFEPGVVVQAKRGEFKGRGDSLFRADDQTDIVLRGYGARLVMWKQDYQSDAYEKAEWRMGVSLRGCSRVTIEGLRIDKTGGDGVYVGATEKQPYCEDVVIRDVQCVDNHRQGISVISAENLLIENCLLAGTDGTAPQAGIDLEPNKPEERMINCVTRNCIIEDNTGAGILIYLGAMKSKEKPVEPVSIVFENCHIRSGKTIGVHVAGILDGGPGGTIEFRDCTIENTPRMGIAVSGKSADAARLRFVNCNLKNVHTSSDHPNTPIYYRLYGPDVITRDGGLDFINCYLYDEKDRPVAFIDPDKQKQKLFDIKGEVEVVNPHGVTPPDWKVELDGVDLKFTSFEP
jgi:hypothetical protein